MWRRILFIAGMLLCIYPVIGNALTTRKQQEVIAREVHATVSADILGILEIPKIAVRLPIYKDVSEQMLQNGVGHLKQSSIPGDEISTHCLLAGHRGLPHARLLARLGEMEEGDRFYISIGQEQYVYQVCGIHVISPDETDILRVQTGKDLVSLITCTPYGINTHRLVVTGERME